MRSKSVGHFSRARRMKLMMLLATATLLTACDYLDKRSFDKERSGAAYQAAMTDYRAGRIAEAINGLKSVCMADPANSSARFQLACLLQDHAKDYFAAACSYHEYLLQQPGSDKSKLANDRVNECEKLLAKALAKKYNLDASSASMESELNSVRAALKGEHAQGIKVKKDLEYAMRRVSALSAENERLKSILRSEDKSEIKVANNVDSEIKEAKELIDEGAGEEVKPETGTAEAKALLADEQNEVAPMIDQSPDAKAKRDAARAAAREAERKQAENASKHEKRPEYYVVQKDDTLYKIAIRFYGTRKAWSAIRNANKATITTDGRVKAGQRIKLPAVE